MRGLGWLLGLALLLSGAAQAADTQLEALRTELALLRADAGTQDKLRGAGPRLTTVKHRLRAWIETRLPALSPDGDAEAFQKQLNDELKQAAVHCGAELECAYEFPPQFSYLGYLHDIHLERRDGGLLVVKTSAGILCGFDESAYLYQWTGKQWQRIWHSEQTVYAEKKYAPQWISKVLLSSSSGGGFLVATLGASTWCSSNWHGTDYRLWRIPPKPSAAVLLLNRSEYSFEDLLEGRLDKDELTVEFLVRSIDTGVHNRDVARLFRVRGNKVLLADPVALTPRDFTEEWLTRSWAESRRWVRPDSRPTLRLWHRKLHNELVSGDFTDDSGHCTGKPDRWQIGISFLDSHYKNQPPSYFLVSRKPPYHFEMTAIASHPWPDCVGEPLEMMEHRPLLPSGYWPSLEPRSLDAEAPR